MDEVVIQFIQNISWAGVAGLFLYYVLRPLVSMIVERIGSGSLRKKVEIIEKGDLVDIRNDIEDLKRDVREVRKDLGHLRDRVGRIEGKINHHIYNGK